MNRFSEEFKEKATKLVTKGIHPNDIFKNHGIDISNKQKDYTSKLISRWKKRTLKSKEKNLKKKMEYLEAQVVYLKAENHFLKQLPKKKEN